MAESSETPAPAAGRQGPAAGPDASLAGGAHGVAHRVADGRERRLDPRTVTVQRLTGAIAAAAFSLVSLIGAVSAILGASAPRLQAALWLVLWLALSLAAGMVAWLLPPLRYRRVSYRLDDRGLRIRSGVWWRSTVDVPHSRVQHTDVQQGPIERGFGLATLIVHTAGTQHAVIALPGLAHPTAIEIRDYLLEDERSPQAHG